MDVNIASLEPTSFNFKILNYFRVYISKGKLKMPKIKEKVSIYTQSKDSVTALTVCRYAITLSMAFKDLL